MPRSFEERLHIIKQYGSSSQAYSSLQEGMEYFDVEEGFIAFARFGTFRDIPFVLSDPIVPDHALEAVLDKFLAAHPKAAFFHISERLADPLAKRGYAVNRFGVETVLDPHRFSTAGDRMKSVRRRVEKLNQEGYTLQELPAHAVDWNRIKEISEKWIRTKRTRR